MAQLTAGDRLVASRALFGSCLYVVAELLPRFGIETRLIDGTDLGAWKEALAPGAQAVFLETPSNPTLEIIDIAAVSEIAHAAGAKVVVDNVFATPLLQRPLALGARSEEHTSELQSLMRISYAVFCLKKKKQNISTQTHTA